MNLLIFFILTVLVCFEGRGVDDIIYVIGSRDEAFLASGRVPSVSKEELQQFEYGDPLRALQKVSGLYLQEEDGFGLRPNIGLRGATPHRSKKITLMEDGILIAPAPYSAPAAYFFPNMMKVEGVEVFKGSASVEYGPRSIGGAINFLTNSIPEKKRSEIGVSYGVVEKYEMSTGGPKGPLKYLLEYNRMESRGFKGLPNGQDTGFEKDDVMVKGEYDLDRYQQKISLKSSYARERSYETYLGLTRQDFKKSSDSRYAASSNDLMRWEHRQYQLRYSLAPRQEIKMETALYYHRFDRNWSKFGGFNNGVHVSNYLDFRSESFDPHFLRILRGETNSVLADGEDEIILGHNKRAYYSAGAMLKISLMFQSKGSIYHNMSLKFNYHQDQVKRLHTRDNVKMQDGVLVPVLKGLPGVQNMDTAYAKVFFLEDEIDFPNDFVASLGVRIEDVETKRELLNNASKSTNNKYQSLAPGLRVQYFPRRDLNVIFGISRGISPVSPGQMREVKPEESINYEAGLRYKKLFQGELIGFFNDYKNIKGFCSFSSGCEEQNLDREFNGARAKVYGLEARISKEFQISSFSFPFDLNYTKTFAYFLDNIESINREWGIGLIQKGDPLPYIPKDKLSLSLGGKYKKLSSFLIYNWQGLVYDQAVKKKRKTIDSYGIFDWVGAYQYSKQSKVFFRIDNLSAREYIVSLRPFGARPGRPQSFHIGLKHVF